MQKRGLSNIVTIIIIVLVAIAAIVVLWIVLDIDIEISSDSKISNLQMDRSNNLKFTLENGGKESIKGFLIILKDTSKNEETINYFEDTPLDPKEIKEIIITKDSASGGPVHTLSSNITEISIYAIIETPEGNVTSPTPIALASEIDENNATSKFECVANSACTAQTCGGKCTNNVCDYQKVTFKKTYGTSFRDSALSIIQTSDGYFIAGFRNALSWIFKTDFSSAKEWEKTGFSPYLEEVSAPSSIIKTSDGFVAIGYTYINNKSNIGLIKMNNSGKFTWFKEFNGAENEDDYGKSVIQTSDGFVLLGTTVSMPINNDIWMIKTDYKGNLNWSKIFGGASEDATHFEHSLVQASDGYIFTGSTNSFGAGKDDVWLIKTDLSGNHVWNKTFGGPNHDEGFSLINVSDGYLVAGSTSSFGAGKDDVWLIKTNLSGDHVWNKTFGGPNNDVAYSLTQTSYGYIIAGSTNSFGAGNSDVWMIKTNMSGDHVWDKTFGGSNSDSGMSVVQTLDGGFAIAGRTYSFGAGDVDIWFIKTDENGCIKS
jgi:hypothetical protein